MRVQIIIVIEDADKKEIQYLKEWIEKHKDKLGSRVNVVVKSEESKVYTRQQ